MHDRVRSGADFLGLIKNSMQLQKMNQLTVISVDPPDDKSASITLRSEKGEVVAFCHPCSLVNSDLIENRLSVLDVDVIAAYLSDWPDDEKESLSTECIERVGHYAYRGRGRVVDQEEGLVEVLGFIIGMGALSDGHVDFEITRLDVRT